MIEKKAAKNKSIKPFATIRSVGFAGVYLNILAHGPVPANKKAIKKAGMDATGIRLTGILSLILNVKVARYGYANTCVGGGQGVATIIEREAYEWC